MDELSGESIGQYAKLEEIGRGGMSVVYKAHDKVLNRDVALKFFTDLASNGELKERFMREAKAAARLNHANICNVYTIDETEDGHPFMVMPFLEGYTLEAMLREKPLDLATTVNYAKQIARGLASAHRLGIVHRDVKPANIFITTQGTVKLLDFGVARWQRFEDTQLTRPGSMIGTIQYMPPEQILSREVDNRADIWALGAVIFEMLTGLSPFGTGHNMLASINSIINEGIPDLENYYDEPPQMLLNVMKKTLAKDPHERYNSILELLEDLDQVEVPGPNGQATFILRY
ncbi:MAG: serine/threonine-protein kinase [Deinococcales bacterium]